MSRDTWTTSPRGGDGHQVTGQVLPLYGQMAVGTALRALGVAGHLRHVRCLVGDGGQSRWVTRTFWSRTARDNEWWDALPRPPDRAGAAPSGDAPPGPAPQLRPPAPPRLRPTPYPTHRPHRPRPATVRCRARRGPREPARPDPSPAYLALARLGRTEPRLALSAADCTALEGLAAAWLAPGREYRLPDPCPDVRAPRRRSTHPSASYAAASSTRSRHTCRHTAPAALSRPGRRC